MIARHPVLPPEFEPQRQEIQNILAATKKQPMPVAAQWIANYVRADEARAGSRFLVVDGRPYLFSARKRQLYVIDKERRFLAYMTMVYGLNGRDTVTGFVMQFLESFALWNGEKREARRFAEFANGVLYLSNYDGTVWRVTGEGVTVDPATGKLTDDLWSRGAPIPSATPPVGIGIENNGEHVVFTDDDGGTPIVDPVIGRNGRLFRFLGSVTWARETIGEMRPKEQARALLVWMFALAFPDLFPTKPLLLVEGAPGSGKSTVLQMIQAMLHGRVRPLAISENGERDFWVALLRSPIAILDNTDDFVRWVPDAVCAYTTGGGRAERELHTNTGEVWIQPRAFLAVASKNPQSFRREDVADRSIVLRMARRPKDRQSAAIDLFENIATSRPLIYGEWLYYLNRVVAALNQGKRYPVSHRMADFERFAHAVAEALCWPAERVIQLMDAIQRERVAFAAETDVVLELLEQWIELPGNHERPITSRDLFKELNTLAQYDGKVFVKSPQALAQRLRAPHVHERFMIVDEIDRRNNTKRYHIAPMLPVGESN